MTSIVFYYSFRKKVRLSLFSLFMGCNCVILCSDKFLDVIFAFSWENFAILFQRTITTLIQYSPIESFAAEFQRVRGSVAAAIGFTTKTQHVWTPEFVFEKTEDQALFCHVFLCSSQHNRGKKIPTASAVKQSVQTFDRSCSHSVFISGRIQSSSSFWQEQDRVNRCPFTIRGTSLRQIIWWKSCNTVPTSGVSIIEE